MSAYRARVRRLAPGWWVATVEGWEVWDLGTPVRRHGRSEAHALRRARAWCERHAARERARSREVRTLLAFRLFAAPRALPPVAHVPPDQP